MNIPSTIRPAVVAGIFYPDNPTELAHRIDEYLSMAMPLSRHRARPPAGMMVPHAGYDYSGPVAASAYAHLVSSRHRIKRVLVIGPSHRFAFRGLALSGADYFATPLGNCAVDTQAMSRLTSLATVHVIEQAHRHEHSLEVQLPFLQTVLTEFLLIPIVVGDATAEEVCQVIESEWHDRETLVVISSDLSHYRDYQTARRLDAITSQAIVSFKHKHISPDDACGCHAVNGFLMAAQKQQLHAEIVDLRNSGDTAGPRDRVVGYGAYLFYGAEKTTA